MGTSISLLQSAKRQVMATAVKLDRCVCMCGVWC